MTLIELFAWMTDQLLYRLNRVPDRHYIKFLDLIGVSLFPPTAARTAVTFWLSAPQPDVVRIAPGTQVGTVRTETDESIVFASLEELPIVPSTLAQFGSMIDGKSYRDHWTALEKGTGVFCFKDVPRPGDALYVGLSEAVPSNARLRFRCDIEGVGVDPRNPPLAWEAWDGDSWAPCELDWDTTGGLNRDGDVVIHVPRDLSRRSSPSNAPAGSAPASPAVRGPARVQRIAEHQGPRGDHHRRHGRCGQRRDHPGRGSGRVRGVPGQRFPSCARRSCRATNPPSSRCPATKAGRSGARSPTSPARARPTRTSRSTWRWARSSSAAVRLDDGDLRQYGAVPAKGARLRLREYRTGGGRRGNVAARSLTVLKASIPFVARVEDRKPARGGVDGEDVENAKIRGPIRLRTRGQAVTTEDFEHLAREAAPE